MLAEKDPPRYLAKVDATVETTLSDRFGLSGFPTMLFFRGGEHLEFHGGAATSEVITDWVLRMSGPPSARVTCSELRTKIEEDRFVLAFFGEESDPLFADAHLAYAQKDADLSFVHTNEDDCANEFGVELPAEVFFRKFDEPIVVYSGNPNKDELVTWATRLTIPTCFEFAHEHVYLVSRERHPTLILFRSGDDKDADFMKVYKEAAATYKGRLLFSYSDIEDDQTPTQVPARLAQMLGVEKEHLPTLRALLPAENMKKLEAPTKPADLTVENIGTFIDDIFSGRLQEQIRSEEAPEQSDDAVRVIVGSTHDNIVMDPTKDVFVMYYAPWCGFCKALAPTWGELAELYKEAAVDDLVIAKFDATENEAKDVKITGFPTMIFYPKDNKAGIVYDEGRELPDLVAWITEHSPVMKAHRGDVKEEL